jgi:hypothetical protein
MVQLALDGRRLLELGRPRSTLRAVTSAGFLKSRDYEGLCRQSRAWPERIGSDAEGEALRALAVSRGLGLHASAF